MQGAAGLKIRTSMRTKRAKRSCAALPGSRGEIPIYLTTPFLRAG